MREREIFPPNSLTRVSDTTDAPFRWICQVETTSTDGTPLSTGTGFLIGPRHVLTSAHVIYPIRPGEKRPRQMVRGIRVYPGRHGSREPFGGHDANGWIVRDEWNSGREVNCTWDYGLIRLKTNLGERRFSALRNQTLGFWGRDPGTRFVPINPVTQLDGRDLFSAGYPFRRGVNELAARVMKQSEGRVTGSAALTRCVPDEPFRGLLDQNVLLDARVLLHDVDTEKGQSGCPIWTRDGANLTLAAIHYGAITPSGGARNVAVIVTQEVFDQVNEWVRNFVE
jgi:V8-like Glu-specific endopeptidase